MHHYYPPHHPGHGHPEQNRETPAENTASPPQTAEPTAIPPVADFVEASCHTPPPVGQQAAEAASPPPPPAPSLEEQLHLAEQKASEHYDAWLRAKAEGENIRRRAQDDIAKAHKFAVERFSGDLLAVKDSLEAALAIQNQSAESLYAGVELTLKQLIAAFEKSGLKEVNPTGQKFDPYFHQAMAMIESEQEPNTVVNVMQKGYLIADRVLRPALVMVAKAKPTPEPIPPVSTAPIEPPTA